MTSDPHVSKPAPTSAKAAQAGVLERLGRYDLIHRLGAGGMAEVFLARQRGPMGFEKLVVVKKIHEALARQPSFIEMLLKEARVSGLLKHPNIVDIYDLGHAGKTYFIAMEYLAGQPLTRLITQGVRRKQVLPINDAAKIAAEAAAGLDAAHNLKSMTGESIELIHRDVSPGNIVVLYDGAVKLVDFGIAKAHGEVTDAGGPRMLKGKTGYVSPEQIETGHVDRRSDVFALGIVLWESLTMRRLYRTDDERATLDLIKHGDTTPPSKFRRDVPAELDAICLRALAKDPADRFQSAGDMRAALEEYLWNADYGKREAPLASFMEQLFADSIGEDRRVVQQVLSPDPRPVTTEEDMAEVLLEETSESELLIAGPSEVSERHTPLPLPPPRASASMPAVGAVDEEPSIELHAPEDIELHTPIVAPLAYDQQRRRRRTIMLAVGGLLLLIAVISVAAGMSGDAATDPAGAAEPPEPGPSEPARAARPAPADDEPAPPVTAVDEPAADSEPATDEPALDESAADEPDEPAPAEPAPRPRRAERADPEPAAGDDRAPEPAARPDRSKAERLYKAGFRSFVRGDTASAQRSFRAAISADSGYAPSYRGMGLCYERLGKARAARRYLEKYLALAPRAGDANAIRTRIERL